MLSKNTIKYINSLKISKFRHEHRAFIVEGTKSVSELLQSSTEVLALYATETWIAQNPEPTTALHVVTDSEMNRISSLNSPPGILAVAKIPDFQQQHYTSKGNFGLVLDGINDPGNLGTIIRSADWFGLRNIIISKDTVDPYHPKVVQSTMGSIFRIQFLETDLEEFLTNARSSGTKVFGAVMEGSNVYTTNLTNVSALLVIGSESHGIKKPLLKCIDTMITIPRIRLEGNQSAESLNAAVAGSLLLAEFMRGQLIK